MNVRAILDGWIATHPRFDAFTHYLTASMWHFMAFLIAAQALVIAPCVVKDWIAAHRNREEQ